MISSAPPFQLPEQPSNSQPQVFDYEALSTKTRIVVQQRTSEIKSLVRRTASDIIEIGQKLIEVKQQLGHGSFCEWLKIEFKWSEQTARQFMHVATWALQVKSTNFLDLVDLSIAASALYLLAAPSTPSDVREEALKRAALGEAITHNKAKAIVSDYKKSADLSPTKVASVDVSTATVERELLNTGEPVEDCPENSLDESSAEPEPLQYETSGSLEIHDEHEGESHVRLHAGSLDFSETLKVDEKEDCDHNQLVELHSKENNEQQFSTIDVSAAKVVEVVEAALPNYHHYPPASSSQFVSDVERSRPIQEETGGSSNQPTALTSDTSELSPQDFVPEPKSKDKQLLPSLPPNPDTPPTDVPPTPAALVNLAAIAQGIPEAAITEIAIAIQKLTIKQLARVIKAAAFGLSESHLEAVIQAAKQELSKRHNEVS